MAKKEKEAADARLAEVTAELEAKIEELARANLDLYETARQRSELVANMSHELRTPLNAIIGFADVLLAQLQEGGTEEQVRYLRNIRRSGYRLLETLSELMNFARIESGQARVNVGPVSVAGLIAEVAEHLKNATVKRLDISADVPAGMPTVMTDEVKLSQILHNLGGNAVKFTPDGGAVTLGARLVDKTLTICVSDTGIGIPEEAQRVIFRRFRQLDTGAARHYEGVGLGLYIVESLVSILGGAIRLESAPEKGSKFTVTIPVELVDI